MKAYSRRILKCGIDVKFFLNFADAGHVTVHSSKEVEILSGNRCYYHQLCATDGDLPVTTRSRSLAILRQIRVVTDFCVGELGITLWYEPSDLIRQKVHARAFSRMGLLVWKNSVTIEISAKGGCVG